jgi:hypothetical protein
MPEQFFRHVRRPPNVTKFSDVREMLIHQLELGLRHQCALVHQAPLPQVQQRNSIVRIGLHTTVMALLVASLVRVENVATSDVNRTDQSVTVKKSTIAMYLSPVCVSL